MKTIIDFIQSFQKGLNSSIHNLLNTGPSLVHKPECLLKLALKELNMLHSVRRLEFVGVPPMAVCHYFKILIEDDWQKVNGYWKMNLRALRQRMEYECLGYHIISIPPMTTRRAQLDYLKTEIRNALEGKGYVFEWHLS
jgi:hypothetical protein